jgi:hypothetical protein
MNNISILISGGVGNQMFKIFAAISYYIDNCQNYILYVGKNNGYRKYYWDTIFSNISHKILDIDDSDIDELNIENYKEPYFHYAQIPIFENDTLLKGYFQSHKYFEHNINKIRRIIGIDEHINNVLTKYPVYTINKTISVHYRMGDYINLHTLHPVKNTTYYIEAFKKLISKGVDIYDYDILYFCEEHDNDRVNNYNLEINNALKQLTGKDLRYKKVSDSIQDWEQLLIMTSSKHYIIGNSTFSWFGAYLSSSNDPIICYPETWLGPGYNGTITDDLFPDSWIKIDDK